jgi:hypothetical protein
MTTKRRELRRDTIRWHNWTNDYPGEDHHVWNEGQQTFISRQVTSSEGHAWPRDRGVRDAGGNFETYKLLYSNPNVEGSYITGPFMHSVYPSYCIGNDFPYYAGAPAVFVQDPPTDTNVKQWIGGSSENALLVQGSKFVAATIPTNPVVDGSVSLAELYREGLPSMVGAGFMKSRASILRGAGSEYLNYQFGWKPFVADLQAASRAVIEQENILKQLTRDSGKDVHRKRLLPTERTAGALISNRTYSPSGIQESAFVGPSWYRASDILTKDVWFSGCYTYHFDLSTMSEVSRIATQARLLYGVTLTPEVVWNLAPWSWLVDWVTNVGSVLHNVSAFQNDGLIMRYGYVMEKDSRQFTRRTLHGPYEGPSSYPGASHDEFLGILKRRRKASPFGFGLIESGFTTRQWSILAALGITRAPKKLAL